ncbi:MAG: DNA-binding protein [bacterium]
MSVRVLTFLMLIFVMSLGNVASSYPLPPSAPAPMLPKGTPQSIVDLIEGAKVYDGKIIRIDGEVIGEILNRGEYAWINIYDGSASIGIWGPKELFSKIKFTGDYNTKGDYVEVTGIFRRADPKHGGELDIEALSLKVISVGRKVDHPISYRMINMTILSASIATVLGVIWLKLSLNKKMTH